MGLRSNGRNQLRIDYPSSDRPSITVIPLKHLLNHATPFTRNERRELASRAEVVVGLLLVPSAAHGVETTERRSLLVLEIGCAAHGVVVF